MVCPRVRYGPCEVGREPGERSDAEYRVTVTLLLFIRPSTQFQPFIIHAAFIAIPISAARAPSKLPELILFSKPLKLVLLAKALQLVVLVIVVILRSTWPPKFVNQRLR